MGRTLSREFGSIGSRSGLFANGDPRDPMNQALDRMAQNRARDLAPRFMGGTSPDGLADLQQRRQLGASDRGRFIVIEGPRDDLNGGWGPVARFGLMTDGNPGWERWSRAGVRSVGMSA